MSSKRWDIVFLISGRPVPAMLDMARYAHDSGQRTLVVLLERGVEDLIVDRSLIRYEIVTIDVGYRSVSLRRFTSFPFVYWRIHRLVRNGLVANGIVIPSTYDLLVMARLLCVGRNYRLRHQIRDLHRLQMGTGLVASLFTRLEQILLRRAEMIMISAPGFYSEYYARIFRGRVVLVENTPARSTWVGFRKESRVNRPFRIGFVGIVRYPESLRQLILSVQRMAEEGLHFEVVFAGGGSDSTLALLREAGAYVKVLGPYEYTRDIKRLYADIDLIYSVYDSDDRNCQIAMPNKFYESIITRIPILVAARTFLASEVRRLGIGEAVESGDVVNLTALLRRVDVSDDWYQRASRNLERLNPEVFHDAYERALAECIQIDSKCSMHNRERAT
jgi:glycosyltransferase involved in cell wall biosynthesis